jgi:hypothetical protein
VKALLEATDNIRNPLSITIFIFFYFQGKFLIQDEPTKHNFP